MIRYIAKSKRRIRRDGCDVTLETASLMNRLLSSESQIPSTFDKIKLMRFPRIRVIIPLGRGDVTYVATASPRMACPDRRAVVLQVPRATDQTEITD